MSDFGELILIIILWVASDGIFKIRSEIKAHRMVMESILELARKGR